MSARNALLILVLLLAAASPRPAGAATVYADSFGFDPVDSTAALQAALNSTADTIIIRKMASPWISGRLNLNRSGVTIIFEPGAELQAKLGAFPNSYGCLLQLNLCNDITIRGYGATMRMLNGTDPAYAAGEGRHCLGICGCNRVLVEGLTFTKAGGDGIYITGGWDGDQQHSSFVTIRDCLMDDNRRQGISVISAEDLLIERCVMINTGVTSGTDPMAGIDFEPNIAANRIVRCTVRDCTFSGNNAGNYATGIHTYLGNLDATSQPVSVTIERCHITSTVGSGDAVALLGTRGTGPACTYVMTGCLIENARGSGLLIKSPVTSTTVQITRTVLRNTFTDTAAWGGTPIYLEGQSTDMDAYGNITFTDCVVIDSKARPFIRSYENRSTKGLPNTRCENLKGNITVVNPNAAGRVWNLDYANDINVTLAVNGLSALPAQTVSIAANVPTALEGGTAGSLQFTRSGTNLTFPCAVNINYAGTATNRIDYGHRIGMVLFAPNSTTASMPITARADEATEGSETVVASLPTSTYYQLGATTSATVTITENTGTPPTVATAAAATPNPVTGTTTNLSVLGADDGGEAALTYTWSSTGPATVTFSANGTNAAKNCIATFSAAGTYTFTATIRDAQNAIVTSSVNVAVQQTLTTITVTPSSATVPAGGTQQFNATAKDQFGNPISFAPTWSVNGGGAISASGLFTAGNAAGTYTVTAASGNIMAAASISVVSGSLNGSQTASGTAAIVLSNEGALDWAHWGHNSKSNQWWVHKANITAKISNYSTVNSASISRVTSSLTPFSWTGGTPTASATASKGGLSTSGVGKGFQITVPADTTLKTLRVYVAVSNATGRLEASLSDGSAAAFVDASVTSTGTLNAVYTLNFKAASASRTLTVKWTVLSGSGSVCLHAATLANAPAPMAAAPGAPVEGIASAEAVSIQSFNVPKTKLKAGMPIAMGAFAVGGAALTYAWDFGDGTTADGAVVEHTYAVGGRYTVTLTASDGITADTRSVRLRVGRARR